MPKAIWNGALLAESDECVVVEGNQYFPRDSINKQYMKLTPPGYHRGGGVLC
ncbi:MULTISPECIES: DUF427 domain-containing protein [unclassified Moorena]|uniref:DUF427 domain-containing protein n=1 Tax=unclassified Moorena TaxID=2683338 RepID=UPI00338F69BF